MKEDWEKMYSYKNGDEEFIDENGNYHLVRNGIELTENVIAKWCHSYSNGDWSYEDEKGNWHKFNSKNEEIK
jgi:hypothetical protein